MNGGGSVGNERVKKAIINVKIIIFVFFSSFEFKKS
jgi:hypothetical protein